MENKSYGNSTKIIQLFCCYIKLDVLFLDNYMIKKIIG